MVKHNCTCCNPLSLNDLCFECSREYALYMQEQNELAQIEMEYLNALGESEALDGK